MNSLTSTPHGVVPARRQGRSLACAGYQARIRSLTLDTGRHSARPVGARPSGRADAQTISFSLPVATSNTKPRAWSVCGTNVLEVIRSIDLRTSSPSR